MKPLKPFAFLALLVLAVFVPHPALCQDTPQEIFEEANQHYQDENFAAALKLYQALADSGYKNAALYFNLGNAYYRTGNLGEAMLYYHKAKKLNPGDDAIDHNIALAEQQLVDKIEPLPKDFVAGIKAWFLRAPISVIGWLAIAFGLLALVFGYMFLFTQKRVMGFSGMMTSILLAGVFMLYSWLIAENQKETREGVVMTNSTYIKSGPTHQQPDLFILHEGTHFKILEKSGDWFEIRIADGKRGWVLQKDVSEI